jgi:biopolymer transport protein ExbD
VDKKGGVWLEKKEISLAEMSLTVSNRFRVNTNLPVFISGDRDTLEGAMQDVLLRVRNAGVQRVAFAVGGNEAQKPAAP